MEHDGKFGDFVRARINLLTNDGFFSNKLIAQMITTHSPEPSEGTSTCTFGNLQLIITCINSDEKYSASRTLAIYIYI